MNIPERGDLLILDFDPRAGHEQMKRRPALVLSPADFNHAFKLTFVAPITSKPKGHGFEVSLPPTLRVRGFVLVHQTKSLDLAARNAKAAGKAPAAVVNAALEILREIFE